MSDGTATRRRRLTKTHKRILGGGGLDRGRRRGLRVRPPADRGLPRRPRRRARPRLAGLARSSPVRVVLNLATFPPPWMAALPGLGFREAMAMTQASTALSIVSPAGAAVGMAASYSMLRSWRFESAAVGLAVAITGIWNQLANLAFPVVALALLTAAGRGSSGAPDGRAHRRRRPRRRRHRVRARPLARRAGAADRRPRRAAREPRCCGVVRRGPVEWGGESFVRFRSRGARPASPALARDHARDARRSPHGVRAAPRLPARHRRHRLGGDGRSRPSPPGRSCGSSARCR